MNVEKLKRLQTQVRIGGKGTPRRKKKVMHQSASTDDKRLQSTLKKLSVSTIPGIEEVNIIKDDLTIIHFNNPKAQASLSANTFAVTGHAESKKIVEMLPEILPQLSQETVVQLRAFASQMSNQKKSALNLGDSSAYSSSSGATEDEDVPMLVGDFDDIAKTEAATEPSATKQPEPLIIPETLAGKPIDSLKDTSSTDMETKELKKSIDCIQENASKQPQNEKKKFPQIYQKQVVVDVSEAPTKSQKNEKLNISNQKGKQSKKEKKDTNVEVNKTKRWAATELISKAMPPSSPVDLIPIATTQYDEGKQKPYQNKTVSEKADNNENNAKKAENNTKIGKQGDTGTDIGKASKVQGKVSIIDNPLLEGAESKTEKETSSPIKPVATSPSPNVKQTEPSTLEVATNKETTPIATEKININVTPNAQENMKPNISPSPPEKINSTVLQDPQEKIYNKRSPAIPEKASPSPLDTSEKTHLKASPTVPETATPTGLAATREKMSHTVTLVSRENPITPAPPVKADTKAPATETSNQIVLPIPDPIIISESDDIIKIPLAISPTQVEIPSVEIPNKIILQTENKPKENEPARKPDVKVPSQSQAIGTKASSPSKQEPQKISPQRQPQASPKQNVKKSEGSTKRTNAKPPGAKVPTLNAKVNNTQQQQPQSQVSPKMAPNIPSTAPTSQRQSNPTTKPVQKSSTLKTASQPQTKQTISSKPTPAMKLKAKDTSNLKPSTLCKQASTTATQNPDNLAATPATDKAEKSMDEGQWRKCCET